MDTVKMSLGITRLGQVSVNVHNLDRAVAFYRDQLELRLLFSAPPKMAFFDCGGVRLMLSLPETPEYDHAGSILYLNVPDIDAGYRQLRDGGVQFEGAPHLVARMPDHDLWIAFFHDSEQNPLALMCEKAKS